MAKNHGTAPARPRAGKRKLKERIEVRMGPRWVRLSARRRRQHHIDGRLTIGDYDGPVFKKTGETVTFAPGTWRAVMLRGRPRASETSRVGR